MERLFSQSFTERLLGRNPRNLLTLNPRAIMANTRNTIRHMMKMKLVNAQADSSIFRTIRIIRRMLTPRTPNPKAGLVDISDMIRPIA